MATDALTGSCGCGAVRFALDEPPASASYCHCTRCQRRTGTGASANARIVPGSFRFLAGEEHVRAWTPPGGKAKAFCGTCGSALFAGDPDTGEVLGVRLGALDGDPGVRPTSRQHVASAAAWEPIPDDGLERHPGAAG